MVKLNRDYRNSYFISYCILIILAQAILTFFFYRRLPRELAIHFDFSNNPDFFTSKNQAIILFFLITIILSTIYSFLPRANFFVTKSRLFVSTYFWFARILILLIFISQILIFLWNMGVKIPIVWILGACVLILLMPITILWIIQSLKEK